jgi:hypothetical protein
MLGSFAYAETAELKAYFNEAVSIRLLDVNTGKVLWGVTSRQSDSGGSVIQKAIDKIRTDAP